MIPYIINNERELTVYIESEMFSINANDTDLFFEVKENLLQQNWDNVISLVDKIKAIKEAVIKSSTTVKNDIDINNRRIRYKELEISGGLLRKINNYITDYGTTNGIDHLLNFIKKLYENPKFEVFSEVYDYLSTNNCPILKNGNFLAYKVITRNYKDCYTRTIDNSIGSTPTIDRDKCNPDHTETCTSGLHVCGHRYLHEYKGGSDIIVIVECDPKDIVAIPPDYNFSKMRLCRYKVISLLGDVIPYDDIFEGVETLSYEQLAILTNNDIIVDNELKAKPNIDDTDDDLDDELENSDDISEDVEKIDSEDSEDVENDLKDIQANIINAISHDKNLVKNTGAFIRKNIDKKCVNSIIIISKYINDMDKKQLQSLISKLRRIRKSNKKLIEIEKTLEM